MRNEAIRFLQETASASDPIDEDMVNDFIAWLNQPISKEQARKALEGAKK